MRLFFFLIVSTLNLLKCGNTASSDHDLVQPEEMLVNDFTVNDIIKSGDSTRPENLFTIEDAAKILGEPAQLTESSSSLKKNVATYSCAFFAKSPDEKKGKTGAVYFMFEKYDDTASAAKEYASIKKSNENHDGVKTLQHLGDEAYFHSDGQNFYFILVRKAEKMFRMKVNKITSKISVDSFNKVAKKIADALNIVWARDK
jgi:hypothetical protein